MVVDFVVSVLWVLGVVVGGSVWVVVLVVVGCRWLLWVCVVLLLLQLWSRLWLGLVVSGVCFWSFFCLVCGPPTWLWPP